MSKFSPFNYPNTYNIHRAHIQAPARAPATQDRESLGAEAEEGEEAREEGTQGAHMQRASLTLL
jgi:hypothetical protein